MVLILQQLPGGGPVPQTPTPQIGPGIPNLTSPTPTTRAAAVNYYVMFLSHPTPGFPQTDKFTPALGQSYQDFANAHPEMTANQALNEWAGTILLKVIGPDFARVVGQMESAQAKLTKQELAGLGAGFADIYHGFNLGNWVLRIGEILLGIALIGVGVAHVTGNDNVVSKAVKVVSKGAL